MAKRRGSANEYVWRYVPEDIWRERDRLVALGVTKLNRKSRQWQQSLGTADRNEAIAKERMLATCPSPNSAQFKKKNFWSRAARELHAAYGGIRAYTANYMPEQGSIDHYLPKTTHPQLAYEWSNFRLATGRVNNVKANQIGILDPFLVEDDWFHLDIPVCLLRANPTLDVAIRADVNSTIHSLRLNADDHHVQERCSILIEYACEEISLGFLQRRYPFLAKEVDR